MRGLARLRAALDTIPKRTWLFLACILGLGFALRLAVVLFFYGDFHVRGDELSYLRMSQQLMDHHIYGYALERESGAPNAYVTPAYPLLLAFVHALTEDTHAQIAVVRLLQVLAGTLAVALGFMVVRQAFGRTDMALVTAFLMAIYAPYIHSSTRLLTEVWALPTMLLYLYLMIAGLQTMNRWFNLAAGAALALHVLVRPALLPLAVLPFLFALAIGGRARLRPVAAAAGLTAAGFVVVMMPWWIRNLVTLHQLVLISTGMGNPLLAGSYPDMKNVLEDYVAAGGRGSGQLAFAWKRIVAGFRTEPLEFIEWYTVGKIRVLFEQPWLPGKISNYPPFLYQFCLYLHRAVLGLGVVGFAVGSAVDRIFRLSLIYLLVFLVLYLPFVPENRYAYQLMFFLMVGASYLLAEVWRRLMARRVGEGTEAKRTGVARFDGGGRQLG